MFLTLQHRSGPISLICVLDLFFSQLIVFSPWWICELNYRSGVYKTPTVTPQRWRLLGEFDKKKAVHVAQIGFSMSLLTRAMHFEFVVQSCSIIYNYSLPFAISKGDLLRMFRENRGQGSCKMCWFLWRHRLGLGSAFQVAEEQRIWRYEVHWNAVLIDGHFLDYILVAKCQLYRCCSTLIRFWLRVTGTQPAKQETSAICVEKATSKSFQVRCLHYFYCIYFCLNMHCIAVYCWLLFMCQHACRMQMCITMYYTSYAMLYILWALQWTYDSWEVLSVALANAAAHHGRLSGRCVSSISMHCDKIAYCIVIIPMTTMNMILQYTWLQDFAALTSSIFATTCCCILVTWSAEWGWHQVVIRRI